MPFCYFSYKETTTLILPRKSPEYLVQPDFWTRSTVIIATVSPRNAREPSDAAENLHRNE